MARVRVLLVLLCEERGAVLRRLLRRMLRALMHRSSPANGVGLRDGLQRWQHGGGRLHAWLAAWLVYYPRSGLGVLGLEYDPSLLAWPFIASQRWREGPGLGDSPGDSMAQPCFDGNRGRELQAAVRMSGCLSVSLWWKIAYSDRGIWICWHGPPGGYGKRTIGGLH